MGQHISYSIEKNQLRSKQTPERVIHITDFVGDSDLEKEALRVMKEFAWEHDMPLKGKLYERLKVVEELPLALSCLGISCIIFR